VHRLLERRPVVLLVKVVDVDVVGGEPAQAALHRSHHPFARQTAAVRPLAHLVPQLGRDHPALALAGDGPPCDLLGAALVVGVGAIDEVDARLEGVAHDLLRDLLVGLAAKHHRAKAQGRHLQAEAAKTAILHGSLLRESQRRRDQPDANSPGSIGSMAGLGLGVSKRCERSAH
jgi:hypothetical protein